MLGRLSRTIFRLAAHDEIVKTTPRFINLRYLSVLPSQEVKSASTPAPEGEKVEDKVSDKEKKRVVKKKKKKSRPTSSANLVAFIARTLVATSYPLLDKSTPFPIEGVATTALVDELVPHQCRKVTANIPTSTYLIDQTVAEKIVQLVQEDVATDTLIDWKGGPVVEFSPGLGILTTQLFATFGFKRITGLEESGKFVKYLKLQKRFNSEGKETVLLEKGFPEFPKLQYADKIDGGRRIANLLAQIKNQENNSTQKNLLVFGAVPHVSLIHFIIRSCATGRVFYDEEFDWSDPTYYVTLGSKAHWVLTSDPSSGLVAYRPSSVIFQLLFKFKVLGEFPRSAWIPWSNESVEGKSNKFKLRNAYDPNICHLVKIQTNQDVVNRVGRDHLVHLWYFVRQHFFSRKKSVIPELEKWVPGCGARLIRQGFTIYTQFGQLTPDQVLDLYLEFSSWPELQGSSFSSAVEKFQARLDLHDDEVH